MSPTRRIFPFGKEGRIPRSVPSDDVNGRARERDIASNMGPGIHAQRDGSFGAARLLTRPVEEDTRSATIHSFTRR
jgi:hypothetical protein